MKKWLFNPFELVAGWTALFTGLGIQLATALVAFYGNIRLDGVIDLHLVEKVSLSGSLLEALLNWLCMSAFIYLAGRLFSRSSIRLLDVLGTQTLARFPFFISCLVSSLCFNDTILHYLEYNFLRKGEPVSITALDVFLFGVMLLVTLLTTIWSVLLMYRAYSVSCNVKGVRGIASFTGSLIFAEILSKIIISYI